MLLIRLKETTETFWDYGHTTIVAKSE